MQIFRFVDLRNRRQLGYNKTFCAIDEDAKAVKYRILARAPIQIRAPLLQAFDKWKSPIRDIVLEFWFLPNSISATGSMKLAIGQILFKDIWPLNYLITMRYHTKSSISENGN